MSFRSWPTALSFALLLALTPPPLSAQSAPPRKLNVLFIAVDDLRPTLGCYGDPLVKSPHIDRLASGGLLFNRAYCQQAVCSPSRNSLLTGKRPDTIKIYDLSTNFRTTLPDVVTLPQHFKNQGYHAEAMGKIYHTGHGNHDDPASWSIPSWLPGQARQAAKEPAARAPAFAPDGTAPLLFAQTRQQPRRGGNNPANRAQPKTVPPTASPDVPDDQLADGKIAGRAIERLRALKAGGKPFFLAVGFLKPHLPFVAPKKYWDLYDPAKFTLAPVQRLPEGVPAYAGNNSGELRTYQQVPKQGPISPEQQRDLIHGYHAAVSYMDAQLGRVLDELDALELADDTVVVLWGDHGFQLGEHGLFCKHTNFEPAVRAPLILRVPGRKNPGAKSDALVEFVDVYPSLVEACGLPKVDGLEGTSFLPLLDNPARPWKSAAFSQYPRNIPAHGPGMGHSVRTDRHRLTEWTVPGKEFSEIELYDYVNDPLETVNLAKDPKHAETVGELKAKLRAGWQAALPPG